MTEGERVTYLINHLADGNQSEFSRKTNIAAPTLNKIIHNKNGMHLTSLYKKKIIAAYPIVNESFLTEGLLPSGIEDDSSMMTICEMRQEIARLKKIIDVLLTKF